MSELPGNLRYTREHEWLRTEPDGSVVIGITNHAQHQLGELVFVEIPEAGRTVRSGEGVAVVESVKAASDVYAPLAGTVLAANERLGSEPNLVNSHPYTDGWLFRLKPLDSADAAALLDAAAYQRLLDAAG